MFVIKIIIIVLQFKTISIKQELIKLMVSFVVLKYVVLLQEFVGLWCERLFVPPYTGPLDILLYENPLYFFFVEQICGTVYYVSKVQSVVFFRWFNAMTGFLYFFFCSLCCLFLDLWIVITTLVSSTSSDFITLYYSIFSNVISFVTVPSNENIMLPSCCFVLVRQNIDVQM